jgi:hypothetical protein
VRRRRVDREDRALEAVAEQRAQHLVAGSARLPGRADDGDRAGPQQPLHRPGLGAVLAVAHDLQRRLGLLDRERQLDVAVAERAADAEAGAAEDAEHRPVGRQHVGHEAAIPRSRAAAARCSSSTGPSPRPWWASSTMNATSPSSVPGSRS